MPIFRTYKIRTMYPVNPYSHYLANGILRKTYILKPIGSAAYFDTGVILNRDSRVDFDGYNTGATYNFWMFGSRASATSRSFAFLQNYNTACTHYYSTTSNATGDMRSSRKMYSARKNLIYLNNVLMVTFTYPATTFTTPNNALIFGMNQNGVINTSPGANIWCYGVKIWDANGDLIRDFIPAARVSDDEAGLFDMVNRVFYTKLGTGTLTYL